MKERNNTKGITLIALVITIIVLLILAGVSIAMLTGQNGILTQAQNAKTTTANKSAEEKVKLAVMAARAQSEDASLDATKLKTEIEDNYAGVAELTAGGFPVNITMDGKAFTVDSYGNVELAGSKPQMTEAKIVASADGTGTDVPDDQAEGTELYISFKASLENGTITSVTCDKGTVENKNGLYVIKVTQNGTYTFTITGTGENGEVTTTATVQVKKYASKVKVGDFVNYSAGTWNEADMTKIKNSGAKIAANNSTNKPSQAFQFGGFTVGSSKDGNATPYNSSYAYVTDKSTGSAVTGWRVFDVDGDNVTLISAGCPEDYYHSGNTNYAYISEYILSGNTNTSASSDLGLGSTYTARDWSMYENSDYGSGITATALTKTRLDQWYNKNYNLTSANVYDDNTFQKIYGTNNESLIDNYSYYWLASARNSYNVCNVLPYSRNVSNISNYAFGVRVLVSLPSGISISEPVGTKTVTSRGTDYTYNVWNIK